MYHTSKLLFLYCETPLHAGAGEGSVIDLPIQREGHTEFPKIESSSLKGALREIMDQTLGRTGKKSHPDVVRAFGPDKTADAARGALAFTDARLLLFPVRSAKGIFAWTTCPWALNQLIKDIALCPGAIAPSLTDLENLANNEAQIPASNCPLEHGGKIMLEEYVFTVKKRNAQVDGQPIGEWLASKALPDSTDAFWKDKLKTSLVIIPDEAFRDFTVLHTEVVTRNKINPETGTVEETALFTEEYLPSDSVLYSVVHASPEFVAGGGKTADQIMEIFDKTPAVVQMGGNATIGKGLLRTARRSFIPNPSPSNPE